MTNKTLLRCGAIAGPIYVVAGFVQALTREGFELNKHAWSLLSNGDLGWVQITNFIVAGLLTVFGAIGLRRATGIKAAPILIGIYGASLIGAGIFRADPAQGFPAGTPEVAPISWHGMVHFMLGGIGFLCLIAACFVMGQRFAREGKRGLAWFSRLAGVIFLGGFAGIASGSHGPTTLVFVAAVVIVFSWLSTVCIHFARTAN
jgi:hypothetical protein